MEADIHHVFVPVERRRREHRDGEDKEIRAEISHALGASTTLRSEKDLNEEFVDSVAINSKADLEWEQFAKEGKTRELEHIITEEALRGEPARQYMEYTEAAFRDGQLQETGTEITRVLPPVSRFTPDRARTEEGQGARQAQSVVRTLPQPTDYDLQ